MVPEASPMPTRLTQYILVEIVKIFVVALIVLTMLILLIGVGRELLRQGLGPVAVLQMLPYILPISLQYAVPATSLFAVCCVYGRMAADGEVSTVKSIGVSPLRLIVPAFVFSAILSPVSVCVSDLAVSWGRPGMNRVVIMSIEQIAYRVLRAQHFFSSPHGFEISVQDVEGDRLIQPRITVRQQSGEARMSLTAREGSLHFDFDSRCLLLRLTDSKVEGGTGFEGLVPGETEFRLSLDRALGERLPRHRSPSEMPLAMVSHEAIQQDRRTHEATGYLAANTGFALMTARWDEITGEAGKKSEEIILQSRQRLSRLQTEPWRRWAEGFSCFFFVLVGAPLAMIAKTADYWRTFGLCFLPTIIVYYPLFIFGLDQAKVGALPPSAVWLGNVVLFTVGISLLERVRRY